MSDIPIPAVANGARITDRITDRIAEVLGDHRPIHDPSGHISGTVPGSVAVYDCMSGCVVNATLDDCLAHQTAVLVETLGLTEERRLMTPQGTSRAVRPDETVLGDRLRSMGWWIEARSLTEWERADA